LPHDFPLKPGAQKRTPQDFSTQHTKIRHRKSAFGGIKMGQGQPLMSKCPLNHSLPNKPEQENLHHFNALEPKIHSHRLSTHNYSGYKSYYPLFNLKERLIEERLQEIKTLGA